MHDLVFVEVLQGDKELDGEALGQRDRETLEVIVLDELVQVYAEELEAYAL